jgi:hypothetical protein
MYGGKKGSGGYTMEVGLQALGTPLATDSSESPSAHSCRAAMIDIGTVFGPMSG